MDMSETRERIKALSEKIKQVDETAWVMMIFTVCGHIHIVATKPGSWPYATYDIDDQDEEWEEKLRLGFDAIESTIDDLIAGMGGNGPRTV